MPLAWLAFSIIYLFFAMSIEPRRMPADREGWDPGSNAVPIAIGYVMVAVSTYLIITDRKRPSAERRTASPADTEDIVQTADVRSLILLTIVTTVAYILVFRGAGFVIATTILMLTLTYFYTLQQVRLSDVPEYVRSMTATLLINVLLYSLGRWIIRWTQYFGRTWEVDLLRNRLFTALLAVTAWALVCVPIYLMVRRRNLWRSGPGSRAAVVTCVTTLGLYLVFQQIFRVALPGGFIAW